MSVCHNQMTKQAMQSTKTANHRDCLTSSHSTSLKVPQPSNTAQDGPNQRRNVMIQRNTAFHVLNSFKCVDRMHAPRRSPSHLRLGVARLFLARKQVCLGVFAHAHLFLGGLGLKPKIGAKKWREINFSRCNHGFCLQRFNRKGVHPSPIHRALFIFFFLSVLPPFLSFPQCEPMTPLICDLLC